MGMMAEAYRNFKLWREKNANCGFNEWCKLEVDGELAELLYY